MVLLQSLAHPSHDTMTGLAVLDRFIVYVAPGPSKTEEENKLCSARTRTFNYL